MRLGSGNSHIEAFPIKTYFIARNAHFGGSIPTAQRTKRLRLFSAMATIRNEEAFSAFLDAQVNPASFRIKQRCRNSMPRTYSFITNEASGCLGRWRSRSARSCSACRCGSLGYGSRGVGATNGVQQGICFGLEQLDDKGVWVLRCKPVGREAIGPQRSTQPSSSQPSAVGRQLLSNGLTQRVASS